MGRQAQPTEKQNANQRQVDPIGAAEQGAAAPHCILVQAPDA
jgi:hypothetical protein